MAAIQDDGIGDVAVAYPGVLSTAGTAAGIRSDDVAPKMDRTIDLLTVSPGFFDVLKIPLLSGTTLPPDAYRDVDTVQPMPVVVNALLAEQLFGSREAVGRTFELDRYIGMDTVSSTAVVVGVAGDTRGAVVRHEPKPTLYHGRRPSWRYATLLVRPALSPRAAIDRIESIVESIDPALPIFRVRPLSESVAGQLREDTMLVRLSATLSALALWLSAVGVLAVASRFVVGRFREWAIRAALGATPLLIVARVGRHFAGALCVGLASGLLLYWLLSAWLAERLYGVSPFDPWSAVLVVPLVIVTALASALVPAMAASRTQPGRVLGDVL